MSDVASIMWVRHARCVRQPAGKGKKKCKLSATQQSQPSGSIADTGWNLQANRQQGKTLVGVGEVGPHSLVLCALLNVKKPLLTTME